MSNQLIDNNTPEIDFVAIHIRTERQVGIYKTHKMLASLDPDHREEVLREVNRRRMRAYNLLLRTTSTMEFYQ